MNKFWICAAMLIPAATGFAQDQKKAAPPPPLMMMVPDLKDGTELPVKFSCSNAPAGVSPHIQWMNTPPNTQSFALLLHDPEPHPRGSIYDITHWFIFNIPANSTELPEGVKNGDLPDGAKQLKACSPASRDISDLAHPRDRITTTLSNSSRSTTNWILDRTPLAPMPRKPWTATFLARLEFVQLFHRTQ